MLCITNHQGNANQHYNDISPYTCQEWLKSTTQKTTGVNKDVGKGEPSCTIGGNANWYSHSGKQYGGSSESLK